MPDDFVITKLSKTDFERRHKAAVPAVAVSILLF